MALQDVERKPESPKKRFEVPHVYVIIFSLIILAAIATYIVPAGEYDRVVDDEGRTVVVKGTFTQVESSPVGFLDLYTKGWSMQQVLFSLFSSLVVRLEFFEQRELWTGQLQVFPLEWVGKKSI